MQENVNAASTEIASTFQCNSKWLEFIAIACIVDFKTETLSASTWKLNESLAFQSAMFTLYSIHIFICMLI